MSSNLEHFEGQENFTAAATGGVLTGKYDKTEFVKLVSLVITLLVAHALRLQLSGGFSLDGFNKDFFNSVGGLVIGQLINTFGVSKLFDDPDGPSGPEKSIVGKYYEETKVIQDIVELLVLLGSQQLFLNVMTNRGFQLSEVALRNMFLAVCGVLMYNILVHPLIKDVVILKSDGLPGDEKAEKEAQKRKSSKSNRRIT